MNTLKQTSGFAAGTFVHTAEGWTPIQYVKVGDMVLSKPESGEGEASYKPVLKTFTYENKELWIVEAEKHWSSKDIHGKRIDREIFKYTYDSSKFMVAPNHPVLVVGMGVWDERMNLESITPYPQPQWKRVDQLQQYEVIVNKDNVLFYIKKAQPLYQFKAKELSTVDPTIAWYQQHYYVSQDPSETEDIEFYNFKEGTAIDIEYCKQKNYIVGSALTDKLGVGSDQPNDLKDIAGQYIPFTDTVYNLEIADNHTYFVDSIGIFVHSLKILKD